jgi:hypothetical protein
LLCPAMFIANLRARARQHLAPFAFKPVMNLS